VAEKMRPIVLAGRDESNHTTAAIESFRTEKESTHVLASTPRDFKNQNRRKFAWKAGTRRENVKEVWIFFICISTARW